MSVAETPVTTAGKAGEPAEVECESDPVSSELRSLFERNGVAWVLPALERHCRANDSRIDMDTVRDFREIDLNRLCSELSLTALKAVPLKCAIRTLQRTPLITGRLEDGSRVHCLFLSTADQECWHHCGQRRRLCQTQLADCERQLRSIADDSRTCDARISLFEAAAVRSASDFGTRSIASLDALWQRTEQSLLSREARLLCTLREYILDCKREFAALIAAADSQAGSGDRLRKLRRMHRLILKLKQQTYDSLPILDFVKLQSILDGQQREESSDDDDHSTDESASMLSSVCFQRVLFDRPRWLRLLQASLQIAQQRPYALLSFGLRFNEADFRVDGSTLATYVGSNQSWILADPASVEAATEQGICQRVRSAGTVRVWRIRVKNPRMGWFFVGVSQSRATFKGHSCRDCGVYGLGPLGYVFASECRFRKGRSTNALLSAELAIDIRVDSAHQTLVFARVAHSFLLPIYGVPIRSDFVPHLNFQSKHTSVQCAQIPPHWFRQSVNAPIFG